MKKIIAEINGGLIETDYSIEEIAQLETDRLALQPSLEQVKLNKLNELYSAYQQEKNNQVISTLIGSDGQNIIFEYRADNQADYTKIGTKLALNTSLTQSIIGSKSHGKFQISREDFSQLVSDFDNHEVSLYVKFSDKKAQALAVTTIDEVNAIVW